MRLKFEIDLTRGRDANRRTAEPTRDFAGRAAGNRERLAHPPGIHDSADSEADEEQNHRS